MPGELQFRELTGPSDEAAGSEPRAHA
jgi:hypothetical protein